MTDEGPARSQLEAEVAHWGAAVRALADLDVVASPEAWAGLEHYLRLGIRQRLQSIVQTLTIEALALQAALAGGADAREVRERLLHLRKRYVRAETILDLYGDAVNTRSTPQLASVLRGLDLIAVDSLDAGLRPLGIESPPVLVYLDKGLGASIVRAGIRLWDKANPSPAAAIKLTRHNLGHPTALLHETGHQFAHLTGWTQELAEALRQTLASRSQELAETWGSWASEVAGDVYAFALAGWAPVPALANVVDGPTPAVYRMVPGDPHPFPMVRVALNAALCRSWFGPGPWDTLSGAWLQRHPASRAPRDVGALTRATFASLPEIVEVCTRQPFGAFRGRPLGDLLDPRRVSPPSLQALARRAGPLLVTSSYLARRESLRVFAWLAGQATAEPSRAPDHRQRLLDWLSRLDVAPLARPA